MKKGDAIPGLVGWEWHGDPAQTSPGLEVVATGMTTDGQGHAARGVHRDHLPGAEEEFRRSTPRRCWWADGLSEPPGYVRPGVYTQPKGPRTAVQRITRNVLRKMLGA